MKKKLGIFLLFVTCILLFSCNKKETFKIIVPSGAPAIAQVQLQNDLPNLGLKYEIDNASGAQVLQAAFLGTHEVIIAPINLGAKFYNEKPDYVFAANITWGNLYFVTNKEIEFTIQSLNNAKVTLFGEGSVNDMIVKKILTEKGIFLKEDSIYLASSQTVKASLEINSDQIVLMAEPDVQAYKATHPEKSVKTISVQEAFSEISGNGSYPQAGVFIKKAFIDNHKDVVIKYLEELKKSCEFVNTEKLQAATYCENLEYSLPKKEILVDAIENCNIDFKYARECILQVEYTFSINLNMVGGKLPNANFYWES